MFPRILLGTVVAGLTVVQVFADPAGTYRVVGTNPDDGAEYTGEVSVTRTGEIYKVVWTIDGAVFDGVGIGASLQNGTYNMGAADPNDTALLIGYASGEDYGPAFYIKQADGSWKGLWSYNGATKVSSENWYPK